MIEIANDVFQIPLLPRNGINCYLIGDTLIDSGIRSSYKIISRALKEKRVSAHALTHAHADHQGSSRIIAETLKIPVWCSESEKPQAESGNPTKEYPSQKHVFTHFQKRFWAGESVKISRTLVEGDEVAGFKVIETAGHSSGHLSFFREEDGTLIVGDVMVNMNLLTTIPGLHEPPDIFTSDKQRNRLSIMKLASLKPKILCFGHGPILRNKGEFEKFVEKLPNLQN